MSRKGRPNAFRISSLPFPLVLGIFPPSGLSAPSISQFKSPHCCQSIPGPTSFHICTWSSRGIFLTQKTKNELLGIGVKVHDNLAPRFCQRYFCPPALMQYSCHQHPDPGAFCLPPWTASPSSWWAPNQLLANIPFLCEAYISSVLAQHFVHCVTTQHTVPYNFFVCLLPLDGEFLKAGIGSFLFPPEYLAQYLTSSWYFQK